MKLNFKDNEFNEYIRLTLLAVLVGFVAGLSDNLTKIIQKGL